MSNSLKRQIGRRAFALVALTLSAGVLAGCSSTGNRAFVSDPTVTGSIGSNGGGNLDQPMPGTLSSVGSGNAPYTPPANIGGTMPAAGNSLNQPILTGSIPSQPLPPALPQPTNTAQDLPVLGTASSSSGSSTVMNASPAVAATNTQPAPAILPSQVAVAAPVAQDGYTHTVEAGESLYVIARRYDVSTSAIVDANALGSPDRIFVGQALVIPGRPDLLANRARTTQTASVTPEPATDDVSTGSVAASSASQATPETVTEVASNNQPAAATTAQPVISNADKFRWPVSGRVIVDFAASQGTGINIEVPEGAAVRAAENGQVIYAGSDVAGYGNLVLIRHSNGFVSAYAHLKEISVVRGETVTRGDTIGSVGMSGSVNRPQLHFELRKGATPVDPVPLMVS
jgi:murein DD-endopeptidase MepM/ murein hydrolase activator NlpD